MPLADGVGHLKEAFLEVADLCPHVLVRGAGRDGMLNRGYLAVPSHQAPGCREHQVGGLANRNCQVFDSLAGLGDMGRKASAKRPSQAPRPPSPEMHRSYSGHGPPAPSLIL